MEAFKAYRVHKMDGKVTSRIETLSIEDLNPGEVVIEARYSSVNYKDALCGTGRGIIAKKFPLVGGIDVSGVVLSSNDPSIKVADEVLVTGCGLSEEYDGGYSQIVRVPASFVVPLPKGLSLKEAMIYGTAGFTASLALHRMLQNDQEPRMGPIVVTGASGGVGHFAVSLLAKSGFEVIAVSSKKESYDFLKELGATKVLPIEDLCLSEKPLAKARFGGAVDNIGGKALSSLLASVQLWGNVACIGMANDAKLEATVFPHILRGVSLLGVSSTNAKMPLRRKLWGRLSSDWKLSNLEDILSETVSLSQLDDVFDRMLSRKTSGRIIVDCQR